jgi:hypothetical protein
MNLIELIESAELQVKQILEDFFISVYDESKLTSHGIEHHRRVWNYSKELLLLDDVNKAGINTTFPIKLIIAAYLHDIGMAVETGERHGKLSRDFCIQFLKKYNFPISEYQDVLDAIEYHDRKDYPENKNGNTLLTILSVSDDLDAFGFTGIFRYIEIYLTRGLKLAESGHLIRDNAAKRFDNFVSCFGSSDILVRKHKKRFLILENFFAEYNKQALTYKFGIYQPAGYCGIAETIQYITDSKRSIKEFYKNPGEYLKDPVVKWFFKELDSELHF